MWTDPDTPWTEELPEAAFYHYIVPELGGDTRFRLADGPRAEPVAEYLEARALGIETRPVLAGTGVEAFGLDLVAGPGNVDAVASVGGLLGRTIVAGVVDGRNVRRAGPGRARAAYAVLLGLAAHVELSTSCSLLHVPVDLAAETGLSAPTGSRRPGSTGAGQRRSPVRIPARPDPGPLTRPVLLDRARAAGAVRPEIAVDGVRVH